MEQRRIDRGNARIPVYLVVPDKRPEVRQQAGCELSIDVKQRKTTKHRPSGSRHHLAGDGGQFHDIGHFGALVANSEGLGQVAYATVPQRPTLVEGRTDYPLFGLMETFA